MGDPFALCALCALISDSGANGGVEQGVEPQINDLADQPYPAVLHKFEVTSRRRTLWTIRQGQSNCTFYITRRR